MSTAQVGVPATWLGGGVLQPNAWMEDGEDLPQDWVTKGSLLMSWMKEQSLPPNWTVKMSQSPGPPPCLDADSRTDTISRGIIYLLILAFNIFFKGVV